MAILNGQVIDETDFGVSVEAGEDLGAGVPVILGDGVSTGDTLQIQSLPTDANQTVSTTTWIAQKVVFEEYVRTITHVNFWHERNSGNTWTVKIRSSLTGADLASGTFSTGGTAAGGDDWRQVTLSAPLTITPGDTYYIIFYSNGEVPKGKATSIYGSGEAYRSTDSGANWVTHPTVADFFVRCVGGITQNNKLYKAWSTAGDRLLGFTIAAAVKGAQAKVLCLPTVNGLSGLTAGSVYYLDAIPVRGSLTTTVTAKRVGLAVSTSVLVRDTL